MTTIAVNRRTLLALTVLDVGLFFILNNVSDTAQKVLLPVFLLGLLLLIVLSVATIVRRRSRTR
jgi:hypothetical protein